MQINNNEQNLKDLFEQLIKDTATDIMKTLQQQIYNLESSTTSSLVANKELTEIRRIENEKILMFIHDQSQSLVLKISDVKNFSEDYIKNRMKVVEDWISIEQNNAAKREYQLKSEFETSLRQVESSTQHEIQTSKDDIKLKLDTTIKAVQHSVITLDESTQGRLEKIEKVMRAEIEQRIEQQRKYDTEIFRLSEQLHVANGKVFELQEAHQVNIEKVQSRVATVQSNIKEVVSKLSDEVNQNKTSISHLTKSLQETNTTMNSISASEKENITLQLEKQLESVNNSIKLLQHSFGDLHTKSAHSEQKLATITVELLAMNEMKSIVAAMITSIHKIDTWKSSVPEQIVSRRSFEEYISNNSQSMGECKQQIKEIGAIISNSNVLKTVDVLHEFTKLQTKVEDDQTYIQNIVSKLSQSVDEKVHIDLFTGFKETTESMISEIQDMHRLTNSDIDNLEKSLKTKIDQSQFEAVNVHVKNVKKSLGALSTWVHDNSSRQSKEIHTTLMDVQQGLMARQLNQLKHAEDTKEHLDKKIDQVALSLHDQQQKNSHFEDRIKNEMLTSSSKADSKLTEIKSHYTKLVKTNGDRVEEVERHIEHLKTTMGAFINEKIIPLATKNELQVFESNIHLLTSEFKQSRDSQRASLDQIKSEIDAQSRRQGRKSTDPSSVQDSKQLRDSIRSTSEQNDQKYTQYLSTLHDMSDRLKSLELKQNSESMNMKFSDNKIQDLSSQVRVLENRVSSGRPSIHSGSKESSTGLNRPSSGKDRKSVV